jgi:hypothetical protein
LGNFFREAIAAAGIPVSKKGSDEKGYSAHGLRKASATIAAESGATESELNAMFGWSGYQLAQLYTRKADRKKLAARAMAKWTRPSSDDVVGKANSYICTSKKNGPRTTVVTTFGAVVISGSENQSYQSGRGVVVGPAGLEPATRPL